jgi:hypothetical protein
MWSGLHYFQVTPTNGGGGWNGWCTLADFYDAFEGIEDNSEGNGEERRGFTPDDTNSDETNWGIGSGFLQGQQWTYTVAGGAKELTDRALSPLIFTKDLKGLFGNGEAEGIRVMKYTPGNGDFAGHVVVFRYAEAHLIRAEAMMRGGTGDALAAVNALRASRGGVGGNPLPIFASLTEADMLAERGRELYWENTRRNDLIRFGQFTSTWLYKDAAAIGNADREIFPIPSDAILSNPNLVQNPGY